MECDAEEENREKLLKPASERILDLTLKPRMDSAGPVGDHEKGAEIPPISRPVRGTFQGR